MISKNEKIGSILALLSAAFWGLFPVIVSQNGKNLPPLAFAGFSVLIASAGAFLYLASQKRLAELKQFHAYKNLFLLTLYIVILPYILYFLGARHTSGVNASMLLLSEIIFTVLFTPFFGEKTTSSKLLGAGGVLLGSLFIMYQGSFSFHLADLIIIVSTLFYPFGNFYSKKALNDFSPAAILFVRSLLGGLFILFLSFLFEKNTNPLSLFSSHLSLFLFNGLLVLGFSKILWYEALKRLDISKSISLVMTFPLFSLLILVIQYKEKISLFQAIGVCIMMAGVYFSLQRKSVDLKETKYTSR